MIPIRDLNPTQRRPVLVYTIIGANTCAFLYELSLGDDLSSFVGMWGVVPQALVGRWDVDIRLWLTPLTSMFLHGGWLHLIGNMWFLHVFGDNIEDALGRPRFLLLYLLCGLAAVALQVAIDPSSPLPMVGASGAIAGVLGAYVVLFPRARVVTLVPLIIIFTFIEIPAFYFLFIWFGYQLLMGVTSLGQPAGTGGVAFFAHVGGFATGLLLVRLLRRAARRSARRPEWRRRVDGRRREY